MRTTKLMAEQAAEALGLTTYDLAFQLRHASADALEAAARKIRRSEDEPFDVNHARKLFRASKAAQDAWDDVQAALAEKD